VAEFILTHFKTKQKKDVKMATKKLPADVPEALREEASILYRLGVAIEDIEYVISKKINSHKQTTPRLETKNP